MSEFDDSSTQPPQPPEPGMDNMVQCEITGQWVPQDETVVIQGYRVCAEGKAELLDSLAAGDHIGGTNLTDPGWVTTRKGLTTVYVSIALMIVGVILMIALAAVVGGMSAASGSGTGMLAMGGVMLMFVLVLFGLGIAILVGQAMCCAVPTESGARSFAIGAVICMALSIALGMAGGAMQGAVAPPAGGGAAFQANTHPLQSVGNLISLVGSVLFILFMRKVAQFLGEVDLASSATKFLIFMIAVPFVAMVLAVFAVVAGVGAAGAGGNPSGGPFFGILIGGGCVFVVLLIVMFFWWLRLIKGVRDAIASRTSTTSALNF